MKYIKLLLLLLPIILTVWVYLTANSAEDKQNTLPFGIIAEVSSENSTADDFIDAGELDEFSSPASANDEDEFIAAKDLAELSGNTREATKTSPAGRAAACDDLCSSQCSKESVSPGVKTNITGGDSDIKTESADYIASTGILGIDKIQALIMFISFAGVIISGYFVRRAATRKARVFFMLAGLLFFGFYLGGCPCPIMGIFKFFQFVRGDAAALPILIWTAGILFLTYFVGKSWCGWLCPLGGLQEFVHKPGLSRAAKNRMFLEILRAARIIIVVFLLLFVLITGVNLLSRFDPFKPVFNLFYGGAETAVWIAIAILALSAPVIYRPFCKTVCPLGLLMGFVSRIPGARKITIGDSCKDCLRCQRDCPSDAIRIEGRKRKVITEDCILCGDCLDKCDHLNIYGKNSESAYSSNEMGKGG